MTYTKPTYPSPQVAWPDKATLPTMYDLPSENPEEPGLPDEFHDYQPDLLTETFKLQDYTREETFSAADLNLYYDPARNWYKRPDWFGVLGKPAGCDSDELRMSYVVWQEELSPFIVVELISPGTADEDFGRTADQQDRPPTKWTVYEQILKVPYYVIYDRYDNALSGFHLTDERYQPMEIGPDRKLWLPEAKAGLGLWQGKYKRFTQPWLRWYDHNGWILTATEEAQLETEQAQLEAEQAQLETEQAQLETEQAQLETEQAQLKAEQAQLETEQAQLQAKKAQRENELLKAKLKELGININDLGISGDDTSKQAES